MLAAGCLQTLQNVGHFLHLIYIQWDLRLNGRYFTTNMGFWVWFEACQGLESEVGRKKDILIKASTEEAESW